MEEQNEAEISQVDFKTSALSRQLSSALAAFDDGTRKREENCRHDINKLPSDELLLGVVKNHSRYMNRSRSHFVVSATSRNRTRKMNI